MRQELTFKTYHLCSESRRKLGKLGNQRFSGFQLETASQQLKEAMTQQNLWCMVRNIACIHSFVLVSFGFVFNYCSVTVHDTWLQGSLPFPFSERNLICMVRWRLRGIANTQSCNFMHHEKANTIQTIVLSKMHKLTTRSECADFEGARSQKRKQMIRKFPRIVSRENPKIVAFAN